MRSLCALRSSISHRAGAILVAAAFAGFFASIAPGAAGPKPAPPEGGASRVVSLAPSVTETVYALGAEDRLVAVSSFCNYPEAARRLPRAGDYLHPSVETIVALRPEVVIGVPTPGNQAAVETLRGLGVNVVMVAEHTFQDTWEAIRTIGAWLGRAQEAERLIAEVQERIEGVRQRAVRQPRRRVLFVVGHDPLVVAGGGRFIDELIRVSNGENVGAIRGLEWPRLSLEAVVAAAPDVIIDGAMGSEAGRKLAEYWSAYTSVPAVRDGRVRAHRSDALLRPGPRLGLAAEELFLLIHGGTPAAAKDEDRESEALRSAAGRESS